MEQAKQAMHLAGATTFPLDFASQILICDNGTGKPFCEH